MGAVSFGATMAGLAGGFSQAVSLPDTVMQPTVAHASWAVLDVVDRTTLENYVTSIAIIGTVLFVYVFFCGPLYRKIEEFLARWLSTPTSFAVVEMNLFWPVFGLAMVLVVGRFCFTADTRVCLICAHEIENVRGFSGWACSFDDDLKDLLRESDNRTTCIAARESLLFPYSFARTNPIALLSPDQLTVATKSHEFALTGERITRTIRVTNDNGDQVNLMETEQAADEQVSAAHNETLRGLKIFASEDRDSMTVGIHASLGFGKGSVVIRSNAETVQMVVFHSHEQIAAFLIAFGFILLFGTPIIETHFFNKETGAVFLTRYYVVVFDSMVMHLSKIKEMYVDRKVRHWSEHLWFKKGTLCARTWNGFRTPIKCDYYSKELEERTCREIMDFLGDDIVDPKLIPDEDDEELQTEQEPSNETGELRHRGSPNKKRGKHGSDKKRR